jgi:TDG/mug DNA glycosylase family protein
MTAPALPILPDYLAPGLDVVFVGAAPSLSSEQIGHYYAGPTNKFWRLLHEAGFTPRLLHSEEDADVLRYRIGLTGLYKHTSTSAVHLLPPPTDSQRRELERKITTYAPRVVCFNGKDVYRLATGRVCVEWGEQEAQVGQARVFVAYSSSARADGWGRERLALYHELRTLI